MFDWSALAIVIATVIGPIAAVQVQKWGEGRRAKGNRQRQLFGVLMSTRSSQLSPDHVRALNAIPIEFYGKSEPLVAIRKAWRLYIDHLGMPVTQAGWPERRMELFFVLLGKLASYLKYDFDEVDLKKDFYAPQGHRQLQTDQDAIREGMAKLLRGELALPMALMAWPLTDEATKERMDKLFGSLEQGLTRAAEHPTQRTRLKGDQIDLEDRA